MTSSLAAEWWLLTYEVRESIGGTFRVVIDTSSPQRLALTLFGDLSLSQGGVPKATNRKPLLVLAAIALHPDRRLHRDDIARSIWPALPEARARRSLRQARYRLNQWCDRPCLIIDDGVFRLPPDMSVDLWQLEEAAAAGRLEELTTLHRGELLASVERHVRGPFAEEVAARNVSVRNLVRVTFRNAIRQHLDTGQLVEARALAEARAIADPLDEATQIQLIETLRACGDSAAAIAAFARYETTLASELGEQPSRSLAKQVARMGAPAETARSSLLRMTTDPLIKGRAAVRARTRWTGLGLGLALIALVAAPAALAWIVSSRPGPWPAWGSLELPLAIEGSETGVDLIVSGGTVTVGPEYEVPANQVPLAGTEIYARAVPGPASLDLAISTPAGERIVKSGREDEHPLAWSPAGDALVLRSRRAADEGERTSLRILSLVDDGETRLREWKGNPWVHVDWSPTGTGLAIVSGEEGAAGSLMLMSPRGDLLGPSLPAADTRPSWSPRGTRVVFTEQRAGVWVLVSVNRSGANRREVLELPARIVTPLWLSRRIIAFVADFGAGGDAWVLDIESGGLIRLTERQDVRAFRAAAVNRSALGWLDDVAFDDWGVEPMSPDDLGPPSRP